MFLLSNPDPRLTVAFALGLVAVGVFGVLWHPPAGLAAVLLLGGLAALPALADARRRRPLADDTCALDRRRP